MISQELRRAVTRTSSNVEAWSIFELRRDGALAPGFEHVDGYVLNGERTWFSMKVLDQFIEMMIDGVDTRVEIERAACRFGGDRPWWRCPKCGSRRGVIYRQGTSWGCRDCLRLRYRSHRLSRRNRFALKAQELHLDLGGTGSLTDTLPDEKPMNMRRRTFVAKRLAFMRAAGSFVRLTKLAMAKSTGMSPEVLERKMLAARLGVSQRK